MQVDPIKPTLKARGIKLLKLKYDKPLSKIAFNSNLRRYTRVGRCVLRGSDAGTGRRVIENKHSAADVESPPAPPPRIIYYEHSP